jgi:hypothetical protein
MITLSEQNLKELETFINEIPTKYGIPLLEFFGKLAKEQKPEEPVVKAPKAKVQEK